MAGRSKKGKPPKKAPDSVEDLNDILEGLSDGPRDPTVVNRPVVLMISGTIGKEHEGIINELMTLHYKPDFNEPVTLLINSDGGDAATGWAIIDVMNFVKFPIETVVIGMAASAAADIFVNGDLRTMAANSTLMVHDAIFSFNGSHQDLIATRKYQEMEYQRGLRHYIANSKYKSEPEVKSKILTGRDMYFTPEEALDHGLTDRISSTSSKKRSKIYNYLSSK